MLGIGILVSHGGSNMQKIIENCRDGYINGRVTAIVCNNRNANAIRIAEDNNISLKVLNDEIFPVQEELDFAIAEYFLTQEAELVAMAGYMKYRGPGFLKMMKKRVINIHPALLPKYGGKGFFGKAVHEAVIRSKDAETGVTIHWVDDIYDHGNIIRQEKIKVLENDTAETLGKRVLELEHRLYSEVLKDIALGIIPMP